MEEYLKANSIEYTRDGDKYTLPNFKCFTVENEYINKMTKDKAPNGISMAHSLFGLDEEFNNLLETLRLSNCEYEIVVMFTYDDTLLYGSMECFHKLNGNRSHGYMLFYAIWCILKIKEFDIKLEHIINRMNFIIKSYKYIIDNINYKSIVKEHCGYLDIIKIYVGDCVIRFVNESIYIESTDYNPLLGGYDKIPCFDSFDKFIEYVGENLSEYIGHSNIKVAIKEKMGDDL